MNRKRLLLTILVIIIGTGAFLAYREYNRQPVNIKNAKAAIIPSSVLVKEFVKDETAANKKYADKIIQVSGQVKEVTQNQEGITVVVLSAEDPEYSLRCTFDNKINNVKTGETISLKGLCKGLLMDELIMDRCYPIE